MAGTRKAFKSGKASGFSGGRSKPQGNGAKSKAQGGTPHKMSKPEGSKGGLTSGMKKGKNNMDKQSKAVYNVRKGKNK